MSIKIDSHEIDEDRIQFTGLIDGKVVVMSIPEVDDSEELCEFPGYQFVLNTLREGARD